MRRLLAPYGVARVHEGFIPEVFGEVEVERVAWAHVDVNRQTSVADCLEFLSPRLVGGAFLVFDDYGFPCGPGAREAVDAFFADRPEVPICLSTRQALVVKVPPST